MGLRGGHMAPLANPASNALSIEEVCRRTGLSRITLNNYVRRGLIPKPDLCRDRSPGGRYRKRSFFEPSVLERLATIQRLKAEGHSLSAIADRLSLQDRGVVPLPGVQMPPPTPRKLEVPASITQIGYPAYLLNRNWDIEWINEAAEQLIFNRTISKIATLEDRHFFKLLLTTPARQMVTEFEAFVESHLPLIQGDLPTPTHNPLLASLSRESIEWLARMWPGEAGPKVGPIDQREETIRFGRTTINRYHRVAALFREGTLVIWIPAVVNMTPILDLLIGRRQVITDLLMHKLPALCSMAVLVADLQNSVKICADLPPEEYFQLIKEIWGKLEDLFRTNQATMGKHIGDGVVQYFLAKHGRPWEHFANALLCAQAIRDCMGSVSTSWRAKKQWTNDLMMNIGVHEGREWFGYISSSPAPEFTALGDTVNIAARLSSFARDGTLWVSKHFLSSLPTELIEHVRYGIRRRTADGGELLVPQTYSRVLDLLEQESNRNHKHLDIANLSVTEILQVDLQAFRQMTAALALSSPPTLPAGSVTYRGAGARGDGHGSPSAAAADSAES